MSTVIDFLQTSPAPLLEIDCADLQSEPVLAYDYLVDGLLTNKSVGDIFSPPGVGKSSLTLSLALAIAGDSKNWFGLKIQTGKVAIIGGERSDRAVLARDVHRADGRKLARGAMTVPTDHNGDCPPMWDWNRQNGKWLMTDFGKQVTDLMLAKKPTLVLIDTLISVASGMDIIDQPQQYSLGTTIRNWGRTIDSTVLTISHTNQLSAMREAVDRLDYMSRAGGNGLPGAFRWLAGMTRIRQSDKLSESLGLAERAEHSKLLAFGVSKHNELPNPVWSAWAPAIFELMPNGKLLLIKTGEEVADILTNKKTKEYKDRKGFDNDNDF